MKKTVALILLASVVSIACGSGSTAQTSSTSGAAKPIAKLRIGLPNRATNLDLAKGTTGAYITYLVLESLMVIGQDEKVHPYLATSVSQPDTSTFRYSLRHGVKFSDGTELTSADAVASLNYWRDPKSQTRTFYSNVASVDAADQYTVVVRLKQPDASWPYISAYRGQIFEKKFADDNAGKWGNPGVGLIGSGPWKIDSFDPTSGAVLSPNQYWWGGTVPIRSVSFSYFSDITSQALAFRAGEVDVIPFISGGDLKAFQATANTKVNAEHSCRSAFVGMNTQAAPWNDINVRKAVAYAINRNDLIAAYGSPAQPLTSLVPPSQLNGIVSPSATTDLIKSLPNYPYDLDKAKKSLAQSASPQGFTTTLNTTDFANLPAIAQALASDLSKIGITVQVNKVSLTAWLGELTGPRAKIGLTLFDLGCSIPDASWYPGLLLNSANAREAAYNVANYTNPQVDLSLQTALATYDATKRLATYGDALRASGADVPYVPLFTESLGYALGSQYTWPGFHEFVFPQPWATGIRSK